MCELLFIALIIIFFNRWLLIIIFFPFQVINAYKKKKYSHLFVLRLLSAPYVLWERFCKEGWQRYMLYHVSMLPSCHLRKWIYISLGANLGHNVIFHFKTEIREPNRLNVGNGSIIGDNALLDARCGLTIGENVNLSSNVCIYTQQHDHRDPFFRCIDNYDKSVHIGDRVWIGSNVIVLPGVTIGEGAVCCAGCVVTKDVEPYSVIAGVPAKKVNERPHKLYYQFDGVTCRFY